MDDNQSTLGSIYWDTNSITSGSTMPAEDFYTPTGSLLDISIFEQCKDADSSESSENVTPRLGDPEITQDEIEILPTIDNITSSECIVTQRSSTVVPARPPPIKLQKGYSVDIESQFKQTEKNNWRRSFAKKVSSTRTRILKSLSISKLENISHAPGGMLLSMRNSFRRLRPNEKHKSSVSNKHKEPKTMKDTLGSDCEYFNFDKCSVQRTSETINEVFETENTAIPIKPRRQFRQDRYLTGSEDMLQKAYNSLSRKSNIQEDKSLFDLSSTLIYLFEYGEEESSAIEPPSYLNDCLDTFLEMNLKQIEHGVKLLNQTLGAHFDLLSEHLDVIGKSKKYKCEELLGSNGVCVIIDSENNQRFVALKKSNPRNWVSLTGFLQHIEKDADLFDDQLWVCYSADSTTNMYLERHYFEPYFTSSKMILDSLIQLLMLLHSQLAGDGRDEINPSNILLFSSNLSLICVFDKSNLCPENPEVDSPTIDVNGENEIRSAYQKSLMDLNDIVDLFLSQPENSFHLITASYPLDYLFFMLLKLHKEINLLLDTL